jgi:glutaredoxin
MSDLRYRFASLLPGRRTAPTSHRITLYSKADCHLCDEVKEILTRVRKRIPFEYEEVDITSDEALFQRYEVKIPVIMIDGVERFWYRVNERRLLRELSK